MYAKMNWKIVCLGAILFFLYTIYRHISTKWCWKFWILNCEFHSSKIWTFFKPVSSYRPGRVLNLYFRWIAVNQLYTFHASFENVKDIEFKILRIIFYAICRECNQLQIEYATCKGAFCNMYSNHFWHLLCYEL